VRALFTLPHTTLWLWDPELQFFSFLFSMFFLADAVPDVGVFSPSGFAETPSQAMTDLSLSLRDRRYQTLRRGCGPDFPTSRNAFPPG